MNQDHLRQRHPHQHQSKANSSTVERSAKDLSELIADLVRAHPSVVRLDGGPLGLVATHLPGRKVLGVRAVAGEPIEISVVLEIGSRVPEVSSTLREAVRQVAGDVPVHIAVTDMVFPDDVGSTDSVNIGSSKDSTS